jgi:hypothetical protein
VGYDETLTLELLPNEFPKDERIIVENLKEILQYLRRETGPRDVQAAESRVTSNPNPL